ncbi:hypothetical protein [Brucella tritici]|uniref:Uncharacterized protein n=1 Tax=Brucella tritici TaxID=94626 RepID=A0A6L3Y9S3_9HYPH|nr:hypothetical protein [Brucella tritici]KAB2680023.1 hypothetical protein F9L08_21740 [Brucella tritici]
MTYQKTAEFNDIILTDAQNIEYRIPAEFRALVARCLEPISEADRTGILKGEAYLYQRFEEFEDAITDIPDVRNALNEMSSDGQRHRQILQLFYSELPQWTKCRETLEAKFKVKIVEPELMVSKGYYRGDMEFVSRQF